LKFVVGLKSSSQILLVLATIQNQLAGERLPSKSMNVRMKFDDKEQYDMLERSVVEKFGC
jgi:hypothetical protein